jgi:phage tail protein X
VRYYGTTKYPVVPYTSNDIFVITQEDDRFDQLAQQYYGDAKLWWIISCSNPGLKQNSYHVPFGIQIRIPQNIAPILNEFRTLNER